MNPFDDVVVLGKASQETMGGIDTWSFDTICCTKAGPGCY